LIEDIAVMYDFTVRTCDRKEIIQFRFGDDGLDPMRTEENKLPINLKHLESYVKTIVGFDMKRQFYLNPQEIIERSAKHIEEIKTKKLIVGLDD
jgi:DNA-directed RNA polymerase III subunit RPC1